MSAPKKVSRLLLLVPPALTFKDVRDVSPLPPMGLGYLAAVAEQEGVSVRILDCLARGWDTESPVNKSLVRVGLSDRDIEAAIRDFKPDMVGVNCQFSRQFRVYHELFSLIKRTDPGCITIAGGAHATVCPDEVLGDPCCDLVLVGEAEESFRQLLRALASGSDLSAVDGLGRKADGRSVLNEKKHWAADLDALPFPAYHLMDLDLYFGITATHGLRHRQRFCPIVTSRGCPAKCTFCSACRVWGKAYRLRSVENVLGEMRLLKGRYGIEEIMFEDDNVTANPKRAHELFSAMIRERFGFVWDTPNGVGIWSLKEEHLDLMKASGCVKLNLPVESGSQRVLRDVIRKPLDLDKVRRLVAHCRMIGLDYNMFFVIGMPGETLSEMWQSFQFAASCGVYSPHVSVATPYPGTELFDLCQERGYFARPFSLDDMFIRSYLLRTPEWSGAQVRWMLWSGLLYLQLRGVLADPRSIPAFLRKVLRQVKRLPFCSRIRLG